MTNKYSVQWFYESLQSVIIGDRWMSAVSRCARVSLLAKSRDSYSRCYGIIARLLWSINICVMRYEVNMKYPNVTDLLLDYQG